MEKTIRERTIEIEHETLSQYASFSDETKGRKREEALCPVRTDFQRDRDRIIHCSSFRRLKHKTQVFLSPEGDYYRTRLTHTLEVAQIARTMARALRLNEDLTEAIALGHDLGHTPFGHAGERALDAVAPFGFKHYIQSVRVADVIEKDGAGLNLTAEVLNGIACHTKGEQAFTLEGRLVRLADRIAYLNHDIDDAERAGVMSENDIPKEIKDVLGYSKSKRINTLVMSAITNSTDDIVLDSEIKGAFDELHDFMFRNVYTNPVCKGEEYKAIDMIQWLYAFFCKKPDRLSPEMQKTVKKEGTERAVTDYIAGMTDRYAVSVFDNLFVPKSWLNL